MKYSIFIFLNFIISATLVAQQVLSRYESIGTAEGLSNNTVTALTIDNKGYLWVGTMNGLNRYDGTRFKVFERIIGKNYTISGNEIKSIHIDSLNNIWVGTAIGLSLYDPLTESFKRFLHIPTDTTSLSNNNISKITGSGLYIWVGTSKGINKINIVTKKIERFYSSRFGGVSDEIQDIAQDGNSGLWIGCYSKGVDYYDFKTSKTVHFGSNETGSRYLPQDNVSTILRLENNMILAGFETGQLYRIKHGISNFSAPELINYGSNDSKIISLSHGHGKVFVCTDQNGIIILKDKDLSILNDNAPNSSMVNNKVWCAYEDRDSILWVGHYRGGITKIDQHYASRIKSYIIDETKPHTQIVSSVIDGTDGKIWVGTDGGGLYRFEKDFSSVSEMIVASTHKRAVLNLARGAGALWIGTYDSGVIRSDEDGKNAMIYLPDASHSDAGPSGKDIRDVFVQDSVVWLCDHANYLNKFDLRTRKFTHFVLDFIHPELGAVFPSPWCIEPLDKDRLAIGTNRGLILFNMKTNAFNQITERTEAKNGLSSPMVRTLHRYSSDTLIIGTEHGLDILTISTMKISHLPNRLLPNTYICGITGDQDGDLWVTTKAGIAKIDPAFVNAQWFDQSDGLISNDFVENSIFYSSNGNIYCGTSKGLIVVNSQSIKLNKKLPALVFTDLFLDYNLVPIGDSSILNQSLNTINSITLPYWHRTVGIGFSSLSYIQNHKNKYSYMLQGFDNDWIPYSSNTSVSYSNLDPGKYILFVKTKNNDGYESVPRRLEIIILPPFYRTAWFTSICVLIILLVLYGLYVYRTAQIRTKNDFLKKHNFLLSKEIVERKNIEKRLIDAKESAESANRAKSEFLANMSHEIRTPLNAVHGFCEVIGQTELTPVQHKYINSISIASNSLLTLINDLLDLSKIEAGQLEIRNSPLHIACMVGDLEQMFEYMVRKKGLQLSVSIDPNVPQNVLLDVSRLRQILVNLLGNAIKFTHEGSVTLHVSAYTHQEGTTSLKIDVEDTGIGIHQDNLQTIFDAFSQIESSSIRRYEGTGLGLAICRKMAELMGGSITVTSTLGRGSVFSVILPNVTTLHSGEMTQNNLTKLEIAKERKTAIIISPDLDYLEAFSDLLIELSCDVTVFSSEDLVNLLSLPSGKVLIFAFNPTANDLLYAHSDNVVIVNTRDNDYSEYEHRCITPPFTVDMLQALLSLSLDCNSSRKSCTHSELSDDDALFVGKWLADASVHTEVMDFDAIANAAKSLESAALHGQNEFLKNCATELNVAIDAFDLAEIESVFTKLKQYFIQSDDGRN